MSGGRRVQGPLLTTTEAAALARRAPACIRQWATRGFLTPTDRDYRGWPLYTVDDVWAAERVARTRDDTGRALRAVHAR